MPLPSQNQSRGGSRSMMSRKRQTPVARHAALIALGAAMLIGCVWIASAMFGGDRDTPPDAPDTGAPVATLTDGQDAPEDRREPIPPPRRQATTPPPTNEPRTRPWPTEERAQANPPSTTPPASTPGNPPVTTPDPAPRPADNLAIPTPASIPSETLEAAKRLIAEGKPLEARIRLNDALRRATTEGETTTLRRALAELNEDILFSPRIVPNDPLTGVYKVASGDSLSKIVKSQGLKVDLRLLAHVNRLSSPDRIRLGQNLKVVRGPFHGIVDKSDFRFDLYWGPEDKPDQWIYIRSFDVGLGEDGSTPIGEFKVKADTRLEDPHWVNPRTGEKFANTDPKNPIGEYWIGLEGLGQAAAYSGYGVHGTIDPGSIGKNMSMGCIRMRPDDVKLVFGLLADNACRVKIVP